MKKFEKSIDDRKVLVARLSELTGLDSHYTRVPRCAYEVGDFTVEKDGRLTAEDFLQEGNIVAWKIISRGNFKGGKFSTYFGAAVRKHLIRIWRDYNLKNLVCIGESEDCRGNITRILVESDYAKEYRQKKAEQQKRWYEKKKASQPPKEKKPPMTREERSRKVMAYQKEYYAAHPDKLAERREKNRIKERERRARKKAEKLAAQAEANA